jgi:acid stress-induced BolA-like protein IbaG/YrbA
MMATAEDIKDWIEQNLAESTVEISGDGRHFDAVIVCAGFAGKTRIQQHQMVYGALGDRMKDDIHALSMRTLTPEDRIAETTVDQ